MTDIQPLRWRLARADLFADAGEAVAMISALLPCVEPALGVALATVATRRFAPAQWIALTYVEDAHSEILDRLAAAVRALPSGAERVEGSCALAPRLTEAERRAVFDAFLGGDYPLVHSAEGKPVSRHDSLRRLLRACPPEWGEEWIARVLRSTDTRPLWSAEIFARNELDLWNASAVDRIWAAAWAGPRAACSALTAMLPQLGPERTQLLLAHARELSGWRRLSQLSWFGAAELTDEERDEVVRTPWLWVTQPHSEHEARVAAQHLEFIEPRGYLDDVSRDRIGSWFERVRRAADGYWQDRALLVLLPHLDEAAHRVAASVLEEHQAAGELGVFLCDVFPRLRADELVEWASVLVASRTCPPPEYFAAAARHAPEVLARCLEPVLEHACTREGRELLALATRMLPWLARGAPTLPEELASRFAAALTP